MFIDFRNNISTQPKRAGQHDQARIREPRQKAGRDREKTKHIIRASYKMSLARMATIKPKPWKSRKKPAFPRALSTAIFKDKKDIWIEVVKFYIASMVGAVSPPVTAPIKPTSLPAMIDTIIDISIASHTMNVEAHNEFLALACSNKISTPSSTILKRI
jgi:hypothetical protein